MQAADHTVDAAEVAKFEAMAAEWWDLNGKFKPLHMLNPTRLDYITTQIEDELTAICGPRPRFPVCGCLISVAGAGCCRNPWRGWAPPWWAPMQRPVTFPWPACTPNNRVCRSTIATPPPRPWPKAGEQFDVVLNMEVVEHVADPLAYLTACQQLLKPGGLMICSTINRNPKSFAMAIVGAEVIMRWLPRGTHEWHKFITPDELFDLIRKAGLDPVDRKGFVFNPLSWQWSISDRDLSVNYTTASVKPA